MADGDRLEATLEQLRREREDVEHGFMERIEDLHEALAAARSAARSAETLALENPTPPAVPPLLEPDVGDGPEPDQAPWVPASGWRRLVAGPIRWLLHDHLSVLDRRHEAIARTIRERDQQVREALKAALRGLEQQRIESERRLELHRRRGEAVRELATRCVEVLDRVPEMVLHTRALLNAKEAETVQVATGGMRERTAVLLDELARQQEALLAELIGRRQELGELLARLRPSSAAGGDTGE